MGALDVEHLDSELENQGGKFGATLEVEGGDAIEEAVGVLLLGLGEDSTREGLRKTPSRVAEAFRQGTRGCNYMIMYYCTLFMRTRGFVLFIYLFIYSNQSQLNI